ncbi:hypothetical protein IWQ60_008396 [Tieghemiomyces parasiticus]|uniref:Uncharacterized protein n=1 Tax=Tieghemiomyces parasiticus TaxID=78921 RepID=A0A9W7ZWR3_9FUNG|nr:hypothetical protein IWQ60_008396 [Tieghemiomyces parasiticus]
MKRATDFLAKLASLGPTEAALTRVLRSSRVRDFLQGTAEIYHMAERIDRSLEGSRCAFTASAGQRLADRIRECHLARHFVGHWTEKHHPCELVSA